MALTYKRPSSERIGGIIPYGERLADDGLALIEAHEEQRAIDNICHPRQEGRNARQIGAQLKFLSLRLRRG
jgi:hypothetical protein